MRINVENAYVAEGPLYVVNSEDGEIIVYNCMVRASLQNGRVLEHFMVVPGFTQNCEGFNVPNFGAKEAAQQLADRVNEIGTIDPRYWTEVEPPVSLEERWAEEGYYEQMVHAGYGCMVPSCYDYLNQ